MVPQRDGIYGPSEIGQRLRLKLQSALVDFIVSGERLVYERESLVVSLLVIKLGGRLQEGSREAAPQCGSFVEPARKPESFHRCQ